MTIPTHCPHSPDWYCTECTWMAVSVAETSIPAIDAAAALAAQGGAPTHEAVMRMRAARDQHYAALAAYRAARAKEQTA